MSKYPIIDAKKQRIERLCESYDEALEAMSELPKRGFFIATDVTRARLDILKKSSLVSIYEQLTGTHTTGTRVMVAKQIIAACEQPPHIPRKQIVPQVDLEEKMLDENKMKDAQIVDSLLIKYERRKKNRRKTDRRQRGSFYLASTKKTYHFGKRYLYHRYIDKGLDMRIILQRISNQIGEKQTPEDYFKHKLEYQNLVSKNEI